MTRMRYCPKCGQPVLDTDAFCDGCGARLGSIRERSAQIQQPVSHQPPEDRINYPGGAWNNRVTVIEREPERPSRHGLWKSIVSISLFGAIFLLYLLVILSVYEGAYDALAQGGMWAAILKILGRFLTFAVLSAFMLIASFVFGLIGLIQNKRAHYRPGVVLAAIPLTGIAILFLTWLMYAAQR